MTEHAAESPENLTARVEARVSRARLRLNRRSNAESTDQLRELRSLKRVFRDLGVTYRGYRKQTGNGATPGLRDAAYNFRAEPSLTSLVAVAAFLDRLDLLT